jgi:hypothetical protein
MSNKTAGAKDGKGGITGSVELHGKKQAFVVTDTGEFVDNLYRVITASAIYGKIIGRNAHESNVKRPFTAADISCEGYMFKRGSWFKSWKKRYFVLRRDIHSLCYFASKDSLTLLGAFQLGNDTIISGVQPDAVDGADNVMMIRLSPEEDDLDKAILLQAESVRDEMRWMKAIAQEVNSIRDIEVEDSASYTNWWSKLFDQAPEVRHHFDKHKSISIKGTNPMATARDLNSIVSTNKMTELSTEFVFGGVESSFGDNNQSVYQRDTNLSASNDEDSEGDDDESDDENEGRSSGQTTNAEKGFANKPSAALTALEEGEEDERDSEMVDGQEAKAKSRISKDSQEADLPKPPEKKNVGFAASPPTTPQDRDVPTSPLALTSSKEAAYRLNQSKRRKKGKGLVSEKKLAKEAKGKPIGRPPFSIRHADNYRMGDELGGFQLNLRMENICSYNDKLSVIVWAYLPLRAKTAAAAETLKNEMGAKRSSLQLKKGNDSSEDGTTDTEVNDKTVSPHRSISARISGSMGFGTRDPSASSLGSRSGDRSDKAPADKKEEPVSEEDGKIFGWVQTGKTEVVTVTDHAEDGQDLIAEQLVQFSLLQEAFPHKCELMMVDVYKMDSFSASSSGSGGDLSSFKIASCIILKTAMGSSRVFTIPMKVTVPAIVDICNPVEMQHKVTLGIVNVSSQAIKSQREYMRKMFLVKPYHEVMYSFDTIFGRTVSIEQIYASTYPLAVAGALSNLFYHERRPIVAQVMKLIEQELEDSGASVSRSPPVERDRRNSRAQELVEGVIKTVRGQVDSEDDDDDDDGAEGFAGTTKRTNDRYKRALSVVDDVNLLVLEGLREVREHCALLNSGGDVPNRVLSIEEGGLNLRRSVMRVTPKWQFFTTNLNIHMMSSQTMSFATCKDVEEDYVPLSSDQTAYEECYEVGADGIPGSEKEKGSKKKKSGSSGGSGIISYTHARSPSDADDLNNTNSASKRNFNVFNIGTGSWEGSRSTHVVSTLSLGCPAAHGLKFEDGGLRRIFKGMSDFNRLMWMQALQSNLPTQSLISLLRDYPEESSALFGNSASKKMLCTSGGLAKLTRKRYTLAYRIDMCGSQTLGFALSAVRLAVMSATNFGHTHWEALARFLKIGFFMSFQSMLSTKGDELGMIEDLEMAALWLSLVSVRLVIEPSLDTPETTSETTKTSKNSIGGASEMSGNVPNNKAPVPPIKIRRDVTGRIMADVYVSAKEAKTIRACKASLPEYEMPCYNVYKEPPKVAKRSSTDFKKQALAGFDANDFEVGGPSQVQAPEGDDNDAKKALRFSETPTVSYEPGEVEPTVLAVLPIVAVVFNQGVNEMQTIANMTSSSDVNHQVQINQEALKRVKEYHVHYRAVLYTQLELKGQLLKERQEAAKMEEAKKSPKGQSHNTPAKGQSVTSPRAVPVTKSGLGKAPKKSMSDENGPAKGMMMKLGKTFGRRTNLSKTERKIEVTPAPSPAAVAMANSARILEELISAVRVAAQSPSDKHCHVLLAIGHLTREMGGTVGILCKSGKDRTSQGVTLEITRGLVEDLGVTGGMDKCHTLRTFGARRMNVYANTGQSMYAFNSLQRLALPTCYRPPSNTCSGKVNS